MKKYQQMLLMASRRAAVATIVCMLALLSCFLFINNSYAQNEAGTSMVPTSMSLPQVLEQTLLSHPQLQTFPYELRVNEALALQAGISPNPEFSMEIENVLGTGDKQGFDNAEVTLALSQLIELGDKRQRRIDVAQAQQKSKLTEYELLRLDILAQATQRYYQLLRLQSLQLWNKQRIKVEEQALGVIKNRASAGAVIQADVTKMALRLSRSEAVTRQLDGEVRVAKFRLAAMWSSEPNFDHVEGQLKTSQTLPSAATVLNAIETAPQYLQLLSVERVMYANRRMEESKAQSDITLGLGIRTYDGFDDGALMFNFSMPISLKNPNQGNILAAKANEDKAFEQQRLARSQLKLSLLEIQQAMVNHAEQASQITQQLLPLAKQLLTDTQQAYQAGQASVLQLADAQSELFSIERDLIEAQAAIYQQRLELERITGQSMTGQSTTATASNIKPFVALEKR